MGRRAREDNAKKMTPVAFGDAFANSFRVLWWVAMGIVNDRQIAEDVVQEAAVAALNKLDVFDPDTDFQAWMAQIVRYIALNNARKRYRRNTMSVESNQLDAQNTIDAGPDDSAIHLTEGGQLPNDQAWFDDRVIDALDSVSETARACLLLRTLEGLSYPEISRVLEIPAGTAMSHVHRTRRVLREKLVEREETGDLGRAGRRDLGEIQTIK